MAKSEAEICAARLRMAMEMHEEGVELYRQKLRREDPAAPASVISQRLRAWLHRPPEVEWPYRIVYVNPQTQLESPT